MTGASDFLYVAVGLQFISPSICVLFILQKEQSPFYSCDESPIAFKIILKMLTYGEKQSLNIFRLTNQKKAPMQEVVLLFGEEYFRWVHKPVSVATWSSQNSKV
ncbi:hypothetical protein NPIL_29681 [Nephila pilipes]|uniref:Uncharacterized protein n=1 Tax=Nephila pilipes TaxID=299642 RepID=A0A8X6UEQ5_NEPPI|nr:hypothetical protein NPIL_29681 [Nephila pilipes]